LIGEIFPPEQRGKALGVLGTTVSVGLAIGPAVGGIITDVLSWRYIFYINIPICILASILVQTNLKPDKATRKPQFDIKGSFSMAVGLICLTLFLSKGSDWGWKSVQIIFMAAMAVVFLSVFIRTEKVHPEPVLDLKLFKNRIFRSATMAGLLCFTSLFAQTFLLPFYMIQLRGFTAAHAGLFLMAVPSIMGIVAPLAGALSDKIGTRGLCSVGLAIQGFSYVLLAMIDNSTAQSFIVAALLVQGLGIGMFNPPNNADLLGSVPRDRLGNASGMMGLTRTMGMIAGVAVSTSIFIGVRSYLLQDAGLAADAGFDVTGFAFLSGIRYAFWAGTGFAWVGAVIVWIRTKRIRSEG
jgi:EmrB/QacA subfamily drug resistance transporter